jgi:hypothetical protein
LVGPHVRRNLSHDQLTASPIAGDTPCRSLGLGVATSAWGGSNQTPISYAGPGAFVTPDDSPQRVLGRLFGEAGADVDTLRARRLSVLDLNRDELVGLHDRIGRAEQIKREAHLDALRTIERSYEPPAEPCSPTAPPEGSTGRLHRKAPPIDPTLSIRDRYTEHASNGACSTCHEKMDPIGSTLEHFDGVGRWRATDGHMLSIPRATSSNSMGREAQPPIVSLMRPAWAGRLAEAMGSNAAT